MINIYIYDGTFEGFLTVVFEIYAAKKEPGEIIKKHGISGLLGEKVAVATNEQKFKRVETGLKKRITKDFYMKILKTFMSEIPNIEILLYRMIKKILQTSRNMEENFSDPEVLKITEIAKKFDKEIHKMYAFIRFEKLEGDVFYAVIAPEYNILQFLADHFMNRFADQKWIIYDEKRQIGLKYDLQEVLYFKYDIIDEEGSQDLLLNDSSEKYETLWQKYFRSVNIPERKNLKLQVRNMPKRYWKYLVELK